MYMSKSKPELPQEIKDVLLLVREAADKLCAIDPCHELLRFSFWSDDEKRLRRESEVLKDGLSEEFEKLFYDGHSVHSTDLEVIVAAEKRYEAALLAAAATATPNPGPFLGSSGLAIRRAWLSI